MKICIHQHHHHRTIKAFPVLFILILSNSYPIHSAYPFNFISSSSFSLTIHIHKIYQINNPQTLNPTGNKRYIKSAQQYAFIVFECDIDPKRGHVQCAKRALGPRPNMRLLGVIIIHLYASPCRIRTPECT